MRPGGDPVQQGSAFKPRACGEPLLPLIPSQGPFRSWPAINPGPAQGAKTDAGTRSEGTRDQRENVSRIEKRGDLPMSTLRGYVEARDGTLRLVAEFSDRPPIALTGIATLENDDTSVKS